ncbi:MAG: type III pantothenate kinase [Polaribacter sp.]|jgi:type III pantothenate kinase
MNLIIDVGNTRIKAAVFESDRLIELLVFTEKELLEKVDFFLSKYVITDGILSSVKVLSENLMHNLQEKTSFRVLDAKTAVPFVNKYKTKDTLGVDRIAIVSNAAKKFSKENVLIIDAGTCITYDYINASSEYFGGAISPGIEMRYKSLNYYTSKLPLLEKNEINFIIGGSTKESMHSGIINGVVGEILHIIEEYKKESQYLTVVLTGGDTYFLAKQLKSSIFANPNFVLEGLNTILIYNKEEC